MYDEKTGLFYNFDVQKGELIRLPTIHSLSPLFGNVATNEQAGKLIDILLSEDYFNPKNGIMVPSTALLADEFENLRYWRGPDVL